MIIIPTILYTFFFLLNCPPNPFEIIRRRSTNDQNFHPRRSKMADEEDNEDNINKKKNKLEIIIASSSKVGKDSECPVCLSVYIDGEELRQLNYCKHLFHRICIDKWLSTHCNCPVCRAFVGNYCKISKENESRVLPSRDVIGRHHDSWQGLPDSAGLV
ncbi:unnamed protein product [Amaranthus hypochondriacus]